VVGGEDDRGVLPQVQLVQRIDDQLQAAVVVANAVAASEGVMASGGRGTGDPVLDVAVGLADNDYS
jgi:hypothetical protein